MIALPHSIPERIEQRDGEAFEIADVSGGDGELVHECSGCNHGILVNGVRLPVHQFCPKPECCGIHGQYVVGGGNLIGPGFYFCSLEGILLARDFDPGLYFGEGHDAEVKVLIRDGFDPRNHTPMRFCLAELRDDVGVEEIHAVTALPPGGAAPNRVAAIRGPRVRNRKAAAI